MVDQMNKTYPTAGINQTSQADNPTSQLRQEYDFSQAVLQAQPPLIRRFLAAQTSQISEALIERQPQVRFKLPDRVMCPTTDPDNFQMKSIPSEMREQLAGGLFDRLTRAEIRVVFRQRLAELEQSAEASTATAAMLIRHMTALHMVQNMLPSGRSVTYVIAEGEEIPTIPIKDELEPESAITATTDAIAEESATENGRGELLVPYVPAARRFFLPQWVAFDDQGKLLVGSVNEAEAHIASMQRYLEILHAAVGLAPYMVVDAQYQEKRYGMLGQLINQGRTLASYETEEIIRTIKMRAAANDLNRGLSLSLPYFDDQDLKIKYYDFDVIPAGRIMFVPAFVERAARDEQAKVAQDTRLNPSTRKYLLLELNRLEKAFRSTQ